MQQRISPSSTGQAATSVVESDADEDLLVVRVRAASLCKFSATLTPGFHGLVMGWRVLVRGGEYRDENEQSTY